MFVIGPFPGQANPWAWLVAQLIRAIPAVVAPKFIEMVNEVLDERTPPHRRALVASVLIALLELIPIQIPASVALRYVVLAATFRSGQNARYRAAEAGASTDSGAAGAGA